MGSGNPYDGYDSDNDGHSNHVGGWDHDNENDVSYSNPKSDPLRNGGGYGDVVRYGKNSSDKNRHRGLQSVAKTYGHSKGTRAYQEAERQVIYDSQSGRNVRTAIEVGAYLVGAGEAAIAARGAYVALTSRGGVSAWRAVSKAELSDITENGFRSGLGSMDGKWFTTTKKGAEGFLKDPRFGADAVVRTKIPRSVFDRSHRVPNIDGRGPGVYVYPEDLPFLK